MAFLSQTPQEQIDAIGAQMGENAKTAFIWFLVIGVLVYFLMFSGKRR